MSTVETRVLRCSVCGTDSTRKYVRECHFCKHPICSSHAHYMTAREDTIRGVSFKAIRICSNCKPQT